MLDTANPITPHAFARQHPTDDSPNVWEPHTSRMYWPADHLTFTAQPMLSQDRVRLSGTGIIHPHTSERRKFDYLPPSDSHLALLSHLRSKSKVTLSRHRLGAPRNAMANPQGDIRTARYAASDRYRPALQSQTQRHGPHQSYRQRE